jgi:translation initiation factor 4E
MSAATDVSYPAPADSGAYEAGLTTVGEFDTVESYCRYFNWLKPPSKLDRNSNYHLFKSGIKPMWEDEANANGGKWVLTMKNNPALLDQSWQWLTMALVGEELDEGDEICGAVVSLRSKVDRIQLWTRSKEDVEKVNGIGRKLVKLLDVSEADGIGLEFQVSSRLSAYRCSLRIQSWFLFLVQYGGSPTAKQVPFDTGRPSVVVPTLISQRRSQPSHWSGRRPRT